MFRTPVLAIALVGTWSALLVLGGAVLARKGLPVLAIGSWEFDPNISTDKPLFDIISGLHDVSTRWIVTHDVAHWRQEFAWMALYFSAAVWSSLALCAFALIQHRLHHYRRRPLPRPPPIHRKTPPDSMPSSRDFG